MGVKKSTVCTRASSAVSLYTPASSAVSNPISTFSSAQRGTLAKTWSKTFGLSLDAQPAAFTCAVSFLREAASYRPWFNGRSLFAFRQFYYYNSGDATHVSFFRRPLLAWRSRWCLGEPQTDPRLKKASRLPSATAGSRSTWKARPGEIGFQHGYLLAPEIQDNLQGISTELTHDEKKDWGFFRKTAQECSGRTWSRSTARSSGHRRWPEGARRQARRVGRGGAERLAGVALLRPSG
jgi:hypothetical protein